MPAIWLLLTPLIGILRHSLGMIRDVPLGYDWWGLIAVLTGLLLNVPVDWLLRGRSSWLSGQLWSRACAVIVRYVITAGYCLAGTTVCAPERSVGCNEQRMLAAAENGAWKLEQAGSVHRIDHPLLSHCSGNHPTLSSIKLYTPGACKSGNSS